MEMLTEYTAQGFFVMLTVAMPCVLAAAGVGLVVGILQAVTSVQEQTIAAAPKIVCVFLVIVLLGLQDINILSKYITEGAYTAFNIVPKSDNYVLPADYYYHTRPFAAEMKDGVEKSSNIKEIMQNPGKIPWANKVEKSKYTGSDRSANPRPNFIETNKILGR